MSAETSSDQDQMAIPEPTPEHLWLLKLVGDWTYEHEAFMGPDQPPMKAVGTQTTRALGRLWILAEGRGEMPGGEPVTSSITLGYDTAKQRFVGSFVSSAMTRLWPYEGTLDAARKVLTLDSEGPSFADMSQMSAYKDIIEIVDDDHYMLRSRMPDKDGSWFEFMTAHYRRARG